MTVPRDDPHGSRSSGPDEEPSPDTQPSVPAKQGAEIARRRVSLAGAIATVSLAIAVFSAAFGVLRARDEDRSQLRADLVSIMRRLTVLNDDDATSLRQQTERVALVGEAREIFRQLESVPSVYYRNVAEAMDSASYYADALEFAEKGIRQAVRQDDHIEEIYGHRLKGNIYAGSLHDAARMRREYEAALKASNKLQRGANTPAAFDFRLVTFMRWASWEVLFDECARAWRLQHSAENLLHENAALLSGRASEVDSSRSSIDNSCPRG